MGLALRYSDPPWRKKRETVILRDAETDERFGKRPSQRSIEELMHAGYINVDKHIGPTSHELTARVRDILGIEEAGHGGTLVPLHVGRSRRVGGPPRPPRRWD